MPGPAELTIEVREPAGAPVVERVAGSVWWPATPQAWDPSLVVCFHGGGYTRAYFDLAVPGHPGYSMAEHLAERGHVVVALDQPGVGASSRPRDGSALTVDVVVAAHQAACAEIVAAVRAGTLVPELAARPLVTTTGVGHSLGGSLVTVQQARHRTFDRIAAFGATTLPRRWGGEYSFEVVSGYASFDRGALRPGFYWDDVPLAVIAADEALGVDMPAALAPAPDVAAAEAGLIDVPVLLCYGERDTSPDPRAEVGVFCGSDDLSLLIVRSSGHCSNFSSGRRTLWSRLDSWVRAPAPGAGGPAG